MIQFQFLFSTCQYPEKYEFLFANCGSCAVLVHFHQFAETRDMENASQCEAEEESRLQYPGDILDVPAIAYRNYDTKTTRQWFNSVDICNLVCSQFDNQLLFHHNTDIIFYRAWSTEATGNGGRDNRQQYSNYHE